MNQINLLLQQIRLLLHQTRLLLKQTRLLLNEIFPFSTKRVTFLNQFIGFKLKLPDFSFSRCKTDISFYLKYFFVHFINL